MDNNTPRGHYNDQGEWIVEYDDYPDTSQVQGYQNNYQAGYPGVTDQQGVQRQGYYDQGYTEATEEITEEITDYE